MTLPRIIALSVLAHFALASARLNGSLYALANNASAFTVGVVVALFALVPMLIAVRTGRWLDTVGPFRPMSLGLAMMLGGTLLPAMFPYAVTDIGPLLVASALIGTGSLLVQLTAQHLIGHRADASNRAAHFSWLALGFSISGFLGPVMTGAAIDLVGHRLTYLMMLAALLVAVAILVKYRHTLPANGHRSQAAEPGSMFDLFRMPAVRDVLIATGLITMAWDLQSFLLPIHGTQVGLSAWQIGLVLGSFAAATFAIRAAMPWITRSFREWQVLTFTLVTAAIAFALMPLFSSLGPLLAVMFLLGLGLGAAQPNVMSLLHARAPAGRVGEALGLRVTIINGSSVVLPLVFGAFGAVLGASLVFWLMAVVLAAGGVAAARRQEDAVSRPTQDRP